MTELKVAYVSWLDINHRDGWIDLPDDDMTPSEIDTVAFILSDNPADDFIRLTPCHGGTQALVTLAIPRGCIRKLETFTLDQLREKLGNG